MSTAATMSKPDAATVSDAADGGVIRSLAIRHPEALEPIRGSEALAKGQVNLIGLEAIVDALGERWQGRREQVYEHVEKVVERQMGPGGLLERVSETEYLVVQPDQGPFAAQARCLRMLREILGHFLGAVKPSHLDVCRVTELKGNELKATPVDPRAAIEGEAREVQEARLAAEVDADPSLLSPDRWTPFVAATGRQTRVSCRLEPVFELRNNTRIGYRLARRVLDVATDEELTAQEISRLSRADLIRIDMATIARGMDRLSHETASEQELSLIIPVSYVSLSGYESRKLLLSAFQKARKWVKKGVICEVVDIEDVPQGPLLTAIGMIRPASIFVIGHLSGPAPRSTPSMKDTGLTALSMTCPKNIGGDAEFLGWAKESMKSAQKITRSAMIYGCNARRIAMAGLMGATHASISGG